MMTQKEKLKLKDLEIDNKILHEIIQELRNPIEFEVYKCMDESGKVLELCKTEEIAKASWRISYSSIKGELIFERNGIGQYSVYLKRTPLELLQKELIGYIMKQFVLCKPDHL